MKNNDKLCLAKAVAIALTISLNLQKKYLIESFQRTKQLLKISQIIGNFKISFANIKCNNYVVYYLQ